MKKALFISQTGLCVFLLFAAPASAGPHSCNYCHYVHGASGFGSLLQQDVVETLCLTCHGPGGISVLKAAVHTNKSGSIYPAFRMTCTDCHDSHKDRVNWLAGVNLKMAGRDKDGTGLAKMLTPNSGIQNVVFESRGTNEGQPSLHSFADNDEDGNGVYDGVCEACHTLTDFHRNNASGDHSHNTGKTCTRCHDHLDGFLR